MNNIYKRCKHYKMSYFEEKKTNQITCTFLNALPYFSDQYGRKQYALDIPAYLELALHLLELSIYGDICRKKGNIEI